MSVIIFNSHNFVLSDSEKKTFYFLKSKADPISCFTKTIQRFEIAQEINLKVDRVTKLLSSLVKKGCITRYRGYNRGSYFRINPTDPKLSTFPVDNHYRLNKEININKKGVNKMMNLSTAMSHLPATADKPCPTIDDKLWQTYVAHVTSLPWNKTGQVCWEKITLMSRVIAREGITWAQAIKICLDKGWECLTDNFTNFAKHKQRHTPEPPPVSASRASYEVNPQALAMQRKRERELQAYIDSERKQNKDSRTFIEEAKAILSLKGRKKAQPVYNQPPEQLEKPKDDMKNEITQEAIEQIEQAGENVTIEPHPERQKLIVILDENEQPFYTLYSDGSNEMSTYSELYKTIQNTKAENHNRAVTLTRVLQQMVPDIFNVLPEEVRLAYSEQMLDYIERWYAEHEKICLLEAEKLGVDYDEFLSHQEIKRQGFLNSSKKQPKTTKVGRRLKKKKRK